MIEVAFTVKEKGTSSVPRLFAWMVLVRLQLCCGLVFFSTAAQN